MTGVAIRPDERKSVQTILTSKMAAALILPMLPAGITMERIISEVYFATVKNPDILNCTQESVLSAVGTALRRKLVIGETIHLVPVNESYKDEAGNWQKRKVCQAWNDYKGDVELVLRTGVAQDIVVNPVFEGEKFEYWEDLEPHLHHEPTVKGGQRGKLIGAYMRARVRFGHYRVHWMRIDEIEAIRAKSKSWAKETTCPPWYACKTTAHAGCKALPKNGKLEALIHEFEVQDAVDRGDEAPAALVAIAQVPVEGPGAATGAVDTGEQATDAQVALIEQLAKSHHWTADELLAIRRRLGAATKEKAAKMIDGMTSTMKEREAAEKLAASLAEIEQAGDGLPGKSDELPF